MGKVVEKILGYSGGREGQLVNVAWLFLVLGILAAIAFIIGAIANKSGLWFVLGVGSLIEGIVLHVAFQAGAEVVRLLKMMNGLQFGGEVVKARPRLIYVCSECGKALPIKSQSGGDVTALLDALIGDPRTVDSQKASAEAEKPKVCPYCDAALED